MLVPARTPKSVIDKLNGEIVRAVQLPEVKEAFLRQGYEASPSSPEQFGQLVRGDFEKWKKVVRASGMELE